MKYLKFLLSGFSNDSRDRREVFLLKEMGCRAEVYCKGSAEEDYYEDGVLVHKEGTFSLSPSTLLNHIVSALKRINRLRSQTCDVLSCHDLFALAIGYVACLGKKPKPRLVYDAHEFEIGRTASRSRLSVELIRRLEKYLMGKCAFTIVVNDSIADEMVKAHGLKERPVVVRSTPSYWERDEDEVAQNRREFCGSLGVDPNEAFIVMYHGAVVPGRGIEALIEVVARDPSLCGVVMGDGSESYLASLRSRAETSGAASRVLFFPAVPRALLEAHVAAADVGMVTVEAVSASYYYMLPNKFFENVQAEVPVVASDFPETARLVREYGIGELCDPSDVRSVAAAVSRLRSDPTRYALFKSNLRRAKRDLCWEKEKKVLEEAYRRVFDEIEDRDAANSMA